MLLARAVLLKPNPLKIKQQSGTNASAVTYNSKKKLYYIGIAGNTEYPLEAFNTSGDNLFTITTGVDMRGLWYNKSEKALQANQYNNTTIKQINLDKEGYPSGSISEIATGIEAPTANSCANYLPKTQQLCFLDNSSIKLIHMDTKVETTIKLQLPSAVGDINYTTACFTGVKGMEICLLNYEKKQVYLFDIKTGSLASVSDLPADAITHDAFRFSYANKHVWLYDIDKRQWTGYRLF